MQKQGFSGFKMRSLIGSGSGAVRAGYTPNTKPSFESNSYENIAKIKLTAERMVKDQASVKTDLEMAHAKLKRATEQIQTLETKLQHAINENAKLKVKQTEDAKLWLGLDSKLSSTNTMCDQLMETLKQLASQTQQAEKDQKHYEEMFQQYSKAMDDLKNSLNVVNTRLEHSQTEINDGKQKMLQMKNEKEEMEKDLKEKLQATDIVIQRKDSDLKHLEETVESNKTQLQDLDSQLRKMELELKLKEDVCTSLGVAIEALGREKADLCLQREDLSLKLEKSHAEYSHLERSLVVLRDNTIQLERENKTIETNVSDLLSSYKKYYQLVQEEKRLITESTNSKIDGIQKMYIQSREENNGLNVQIKELNGKIADLEKMQEFSMVQHAEECQLAEEKIKIMQLEVKNLGSEKVELEKTNSELQEKVKHLTEASAEAESHVQQLLQKISDFELDTNDKQDKIRTVLEEKAKEIESFTCEVTKRDQKLEELESEMGQLKVYLDEEKQLHLASVESEKQLEEKILKIQASLTTTEAELTEAKRQYDMMLEVKQLELSKHLKDLCQKNDQAINEIRKNYESEKVEIVNMEKAKADKLLKELESKYEEKLTQNKADAQENLIRVREENITTISKLQQEFNEKELSIRTHHKEELHRLELHAENELRDRLSALRKEHEIQMKSLKMQHEDDYGKLQEELELQKSKEEKQRALLQLQWKVMGDNQQGEQEEYSASSKRRELLGRRQSQRSLISPEAKRKDSSLPTILPSPITSIMRKERKMTQKEYEVEVGSGRSTKRKKTRNSAVFEETNGGTQKSAFSKPPRQSQAPSMAGGTQKRSAIGDLFSEGSLNPYADDPYAFD
ncbi:synaptonemal complex protein ZEP1-like isoform X2 [Carex rostrata]